MAVVEILTSTLSPPLCGLPWLALMMKWRTLPFTNKTFSLSGAHIYGLDFLNYGQLEVSVAAFSATS